MLLELIERGQVHHNDNVGLVDQRGGDILIADDNGAVRGTAAHFGAVGGQPRDMLAVQH